LRFDLRRMSDPEIATYFEAKAAEREAIRLMPWPLANNDARRTIVRRPALYRAAYVFDRTAFIELLPIVFAAFIGLRWFRHWALDTDQARAYLLNCELLDVMDEMKRRVAARRRSDR
jgi:hypothetical protein